MPIDTSIVREDATVWLASGLAEEERLRIDVKIAELDARIAELVLERVTLQKKRNTLAPISRLSSDVLRVIFKETQTGRTCDEGKPFPFSKARYLEAQLPWIKALTHVCSHWRELAINTPTLWTGLMLGDFELASEMAIRSQPAPLEITIVTPRFTSQQAAVQELLQNHVHRARFLNLSLPHNWYAHFINDILHSRILSGTLEVCSLVANSLPSYFPGIVLPLNILDNLTQSLRHLNLHTCSFPLKTSNKQISFNRLSSLQVRCAATRCTDFLDPDLLSLPLSCSIYATCWDEGFDYSGLLPFVHKFWQDGNRELRLLEVGDLESAGFDPNLRMSFVGKNPTKGRMTLDLRMRPGEITPTLLTFLHYVPLGYLTHITLQNRIDTAFWTVIGTSCPELRDLCLCTENLMDFFATFQIRDQVQVLESQSTGGLTLNSVVTPDAFAITMRFPKLIHITFKRMYLTSVDLRLLRECLLVRRLVDKQVHSLTFHNAIGIERRQVDELVLLVKDVVRWSVDGRRPG